MKIAFKLSSSEVVLKEPHPFNNAAHHIVMSNSKDKRMKKLRDLFKKHGMDINDADNGIFLPRTVSDSINSGLPAHSKMHSDAYKQAVYNRLKNKKSEAGVRQALTDIANEIRTGKIPIVNEVSNDNW